MPINWKKFACPHCNNTLGLFNPATISAPFTVDQFYPLSVEVPHPFWRLTEGDPDKTPTAGNMYCPFSISSSAAHYPFRNKEGDVVESVIYTPDGWWEVPVRQPLPPSKDEMLNYLKENPRARIVDFKAEFGIVSYEPIRRLGGWKALKAEAMAG